METLISTMYPENPKMLLIRVRGTDSSRIRAMGHLLMLLFQLVLGLISCQKLEFISLEVKCPRHGRTTTTMGDPDLFLANVGPEVLFRNNGDGTFTDVANQAGLQVVEQADNEAENVGGLWWDYDVDGFLDLYISSWTGNNRFLSQFRRWYVRRT